jgi:hypothetical protein
MFTDQARPIDCEKTHTHRRKYRDMQASVAEEEEKILKCPGAAVTMRWDTLPTKLQRELFEHADGIGDLSQTASLREPIAQFLHDHRAADTHVAQGPRSQTPAADVLYELWRFSCEMPDAPHLNQN